ncbi:MAG: DUF2232 domain-containing protein [Pseudomonadota bacterium]
MTLSQRHVMRALMAGLASAFAFMALFSGNVFGLSIGLLSPLPLFVTAMISGLTGTALATLLAFGLLALQADALLSVGVFLMGIAGPPLYLAWRMDMRHRDPSSPRRLTGRAIGNHLAIMALAGGALMGLSLLQLDKAMVETGGLTGYAQRSIDAATDAMAAGGGMSNSSVIAMKAQANALGARLFVVAGAMWLLLMVMNAGIAGRLAKQMPSFEKAHMRMVQLPRWFVFPVAAFTILSLSSGIPGVAIAVLAITLLTAAAIQGLSVIHYASHTLRHRGAFLFGVYALCFFFNPAGILLALMGLADSRLDLRQRFAGGQ